MIKLPDPNPFDVAYYTAEASGLQNLCVLLLQVKKEIDRAEDERAAAEVHVAQLLVDHRRALEDVNDGPVKLRRAGPDLRACVRILSTLADRLGILSGSPMERQGEP